MSIINKIGRRRGWEKKQLELAVSFNPTRPEAYLFLSMHHNNSQEIMRKCKNFQ